MIRAPLQLLTNTTPFFCPGEQQPVSRSVHLARMAAHFPACKTCAHRFDPDSIVVYPASSGPTDITTAATGDPTAAPSTSTASQLFTTNGVRGVYQNQLTSKTAAELAAAFAAELWSDVPRPIRSAASADNPDATQVESTTEPPTTAEARTVEARTVDNRTAAERAELGTVSQLLSRRPLRLRPVTVTGPTVVIAGDERNMSPDIVAGVAAGLRRMACQVIDVGTVTRSAFWFAVQHLQSVGGVYVTGAGCDPAWTGLEFVGEGAVPWSQGGMLDRVIGHVQRGVSRPWRQPGGQRSFSITAAYEASLRQYFHALRPLRVVVMSPSNSVLAGVAKQFAGVACQLVPVRLATRSRQNETTTRQDLRYTATAIRENHADLGVVIQDDGQRCQFVDETGAVVSNAAILTMLADWQLSDHPGRNVLIPKSAALEPTEKSRRAVDPGKSRGVSQRVQMCSGVPLDVTAVTDEAFAIEMRSSRSVVGSRELVVDTKPRANSESSPGEFWISTPNPTCDAIAVLAGVLHVLSRSDRLFSAVAAE